MIILASASPRRKELLTQIGCKFTIITSNAEEIKDSGLHPRELVVRNAYHKAAAVAREHPQYPVLGSDTVVSLDGHIYGKPRDEEQAREMLKKLSGKTHQVTTGVVFVWKNQSWQAWETTEVEFSPLSQSQIDKYVATGEPADKAGAYAIQGRAATFIKGIRGSYSNVVGLPLHCLDGLAQKAGIDLYDNGKGSSS
ncbi:MAG: septum formation inhibitor Maf [Anaerovibrio sp.]|uniref:Maf family protein n=1 Tax=Anaerovibrio sp. TaxID=1872532 RepID=UPI0025BF583B|nr:Maf family protein [Anaerovibrio sp.]MBE6100074.1 septum formation inhibitor Maf [Anaerovibrio sp.]